MGLPLNCFDMLNFLQLLAYISVACIFISGPIKYTLQTDGYKKLSFSGTNKIIWAKVFQDPDDPTQLLKGSVDTARSKCRRLVYKYDSCHMTHDKSYKLIFIALLFCKLFKVSASNMILCYQFTSRFPKIKMN